MAACGAHDPKKPRHFMEVSRRLFGRAGLTKNELDLLRGVCAAVICPKRDRIGTKTRGKAAMREQTQNDPKIRRCRPKNSKSSISAVPSGLLSYSLGFKSPCLKKLANSSPPFEKRIRPLTVQRKSSLLIRDFMR